MKKHKCTFCGKHEQDMKQYQDKNGRVYFVCGECLTRLEGKNG